MRRGPATFVAVVALAAFAVPSLASAAGTATVPTRYLAANGGTVSWPVKVHSASTCSWSSVPSIARFATTVKCKSGRVERSLRLGANLSTRAKDYTLSLTVHGQTTTVYHLRVIEAGKPTPTTTTTTTTTATTTTVPPTTTTTVPPTTIATPPPPTTTSSTTSTTTTTTTTTQPSQQFPGISSPNWSGYVLTGGNGGYQAVSAEWTVPPVDCSSAPNSATSDWVGVNGFGNANPGLFQDGTTSFCLDGQEGDYAWWTDEAESYNSIILFAVSPGDYIDADIYQEASGYWAYFIRDLTSGLQSTALESFAGPGTSAEWIAEDPGDPTTDSPYPLAPFGSVTFTDLGLTVPSGSWTVPSYSDAVEMVGPDGAVEALPSVVQGSAASADFVVTYEPTGQMGPAARSASLRHPRSTYMALGPRERR